MMERGVCFYLLSIYFCVLLSLVFGNDRCETCVEIENCPTIETFSNEERLRWLQILSCEHSHSNQKGLHIGSLLINDKDFVCCPVNITLLNNSTQLHLTKIKNQITKNNKQVNYDHNITNSKKENTTKIENSFKKKRQIPLLDPTQNPYFLKKPTISQQNRNNPTYNSQRQIPRNRENYPVFLGTNSLKQCATQTSLLPDPVTGCCGRDTSDADRITDLEGFLNIPPIQQTQNLYPSRVYGNQPYPRRLTRSEGNNRREVKLESKLAGGKKTEVGQFPWTALLLLTFDYGNKIASFQCGGSLISSRYIITAAHCVSEEGGTLIEMQIVLAEYDKRTFPRDCVLLTADGPKCIQNMLVLPEEVIIHPGFDKYRLHNDIALVRLQGFAPYTDYIRPICLASLNIDNEEFSNLPVVASGWGRNKKYLSDIKQSTVVNIVSREDCQRSYPNLSTEQLCAVGRTGEDTCKGDSGGPLMILYRDKYYLIGVVSGKRADSPCGTSVPSLYTNVFNYIPWIKTIIRD